MDNVRYGSDRFKVDGTAVLNKNDTVTVIYNINIPKIIAENNQSRLNALETVNNLLRRDFQTTPVYMQITASYLLVHTTTGEERIWTGSFWSRGNSPAEIAAFDRVNYDTFVQNTFRNSADVHHVLRWVGRETNWRFESLISLILNCNCKVSKNDDILKRRNLFFYTNRKRPHVTFGLD